MNDIVIPGLSAKQMAFADIIWAMEGQDQVRRFIATLGKADRKDAETVVELMILAFMDKVNDTKMATTLLKQFTL
jgi:hypothetical protein